MAKKKKFKLLVKIRKVTGVKWYEKGQQHLVLPITTTSFTEKGEPFFQKEKGFYGILCSDCNILGHIEVEK